MYPHANMYMYGYFPTRNIPHAHLVIAGPVNLLVLALHDIVLKLYWVIQQHSWYFKPVCPGLLIARKGRRERGRGGMGRGGEGEGREGKGRRGEGRGGGEGRRRGGGERRSGRKRKW